MRGKRVVSLVLALVLALTMGGSALAEEAVQTGSQAASSGGTASAAQGSRGRLNPWR